MKLSIQITAIALATAAFLTACGNKSPLSAIGETSCGSEQVQNTLQDLIKGEVEKDFKGNAKLDIAKSRATFAQLKISLDNVRTTKEDPNSSRKFCTAMLKVSLPPELLSNVERSTELVDGDVKFDTIVRSSGFEKNANVFSKEVDYSAQPTDDNKNVYVSLEQSKLATTLIYVIIGLDQAKNPLEAKANAEIGQAVQENTSSNNQAPTNQTNTETVPAPVNGANKPKSAYGNGRSAFVYDPPSNVRISPDGNLLCTLNQRTNITVYGYAGSTYDGSREVKWYHTDACGSMGVIAYSQIR